LKDGIKDKQGIDPNKETMISISNLEKSKMLFRYKVGKKVVTEMDSNAEVTYQDNDIRTNEN
jgi:hypothetical protein